MNLHPVELALTGKLIKKAQEFHLIQPTTLELPFSEYTPTPAFVTQLLPFIQSTAHEWAPRLARRLRRLAEMTKTPLAVPGEFVESSLRTLVSDPVHSRTPVIMPHPFSPWIYSSYVFYPYTTSDPGAESRSTPKSFVPVGDLPFYWSLALRDVIDERLIDRRLQSSAHNLRTLMRYATDPKNFAVAFTDAQIVPGSQHAKPGLQLNADPSILVKIIASWPGMYLHELGHTLVPAVPVEPGQGQAARLHDELVNAAFLREVAPIFVRKIAEKYPNEFSVQMLGQLLATSLKDYKDYFRELKHERSSLLTPLTKEVIGEVLRLAEFEREAKRVIPEFLYPTFEAAYTNPEGRADLPAVLKQRNRFMNALNQLVVMSELALQQRDPQLVHLGDILNVSNKMRTSPDPITRKLHDIASYGSSNPADFKEAVNVVVSRYPKVVETPAFKTVRSVL